MPPKKEQKAPVTPKVIEKVKPKPVVTERKEYPKPNISVFDIEKPMKVNEAGESSYLELKDAINYYKNEFIKSVCHNRAFLDYIKNVKAYLINPKTGSPYKDYPIHLKYNRDYNIEYNGKYINITRYLDDENFRQKIINYYEKSGFKCDIFRTGYNQYKERYSGVMILVEW